MSPSSAAPGCTGGSAVGSPLGVVLLCSSLGASGSLLELLELRLSSSLRVSKFSLEQPVTGLQWIKIGASLELLELLCSSLGASAISPGSLTGLTPMPAPPAGDAPPLLLSGGVLWLVVELPPPAGVLSPPLPFLLAGGLLAGGVPWLVVELSPPPPT